MQQHFNSGEEYAAQLITSIYEADSMAPKPLQSDLLEEWCDEITNDCIARYAMYTKSEVEDYRLNDQDIMEALQRAHRNLIGNTLSELVRKGMVEMSVGEDGEIYYQATEEGKKQLK